ncbi:unnamed protein product [Cyprideis torosa]|uniref:Neurotransmitter-gated ion-channel transmembrane domain-containing protein n=1 Tax=Cyprideis torosa TaxID=163714 RepID=A0A7R8ZJV9_9CRUS|nr:unnamed protein product [Cyprideis torosa]CAG0888025.1 unnamed protein product [Cyprideis torosa]
MTFSLEKEEYNCQKETRKIKQFFSTFQGKLQRDMFQGKRVFSETCSKESESSARHVPRKASLQRNMFQGNVLMRPERVVIRTCGGSEIQECFHPERLAYYDQTRPPAWSSTPELHRTNETELCSPCYESSAYPSCAMSHSRCRMHAYHSHHNPYYDPIDSDWRGRSYSHSSQRHHAQTNHCSNRVPPAGCTCYCPPPWIGCDIPPPVPPRPPTHSHTHPGRSHLLQPPTDSSYDQRRKSADFAQREPELWRTVECVRYMAEAAKQKEDSTRVKEDWKYVAMVLDRLFLWIFLLAVVAGTAGIILQTAASEPGGTPVIVGDLPKN